jgi:hypothetical protein
MLIRFDWQTDWLTDWLTDRLTDWQTDWLTDRLTDWLTDWPTDCLADWLTYWLNDRPTGWLSDWLTDRMTGWLTGWLLSQSDWVITLTDQYIYTERLRKGATRFSSVRGSPARHSDQMPPDVGRFWDTTLDHFMGPIISKCLYLLPVLTLSSHLRLGFQSYAFHGGFLILLTDEDYELEFLIMLFLPFL